MAYLRGLVESSQRLYQEDSVRDGAKWLHDVKEETCRGRSLEAYSS